MNNHNWDALPQGKKYESFTGMQNSKEVGPWVEVGALASAHGIDLLFVQPDFTSQDYGLSLSTSEIQNVDKSAVNDQGDTGSATSYL